MKDPRLYPHVDGVPNLAAHGEYALLYRHPDDLHFTPIFTSVSLEFVRNYVRTREWCHEAVDSGWEFTCCPSKGIECEGMTVQ